MTYLLDTDHLSILQRKAGAEYLLLSTWIAQFTVVDFACCVVSLHEQVVGAHAFLNHAKNSTRLIRGYELLERLPRDYLAFPLLPFDAPSATIYDGLLARNLRIRHDGPPARSHCSLPRPDGIDPQSSRLRARCGAQNRRSHGVARRFIVKFLLPIDVVDAISVIA